MFVARQSMRPATSEVRSAPLALILTSDGSMLLMRNMASRFTRWGADNNANGRRAARHDGYRVHRRAARDELDVKPGCAVVAVLRGHEFARKLPSLEPGQL